MREAWLVALALVACSAPQQGPAPVAPPPMAPAPPPMSAPPAPPPTIPALTSPGCAFGPASGTLADALTFVIDGARLATLAGEVTVHAIQVSADGQQAWADVDDGKVRLVGPVRPTSVRLRPREPLVVDGWLKMEEAPIARVTDGEAELMVRLPKFFEGKAPVVRVPCTALTPFENGKPAKTGMNRMKGGARAPLRVTPDGPVVGHVLGPKPKPPPKKDTKTVFASVAPFMDITTLEEQGSQARIRLRDTDTAVVGWVPKADLRKGLMGVLGALMDKPYAEGDHVTCPAEAPLVVNTAAGLVTVGSLHAAQAVPATKESDGSISLRLLGTTLNALFSNAKVDLAPRIPADHAKACTLGPA